MVLSGCTVGTKNFLVSRVCLYAGGIGKLDEGEVWRGIEQRGVVWCKCILFINQSIILERKEKKRREDNFPISTSAPFLIPSPSHPRKIRIP
jgi:hypothetical protein